MKTHRYLIMIHASFLGYFLGNEEARGAIIFCFLLAGAMTIIVNAINSMVKNHSIIFKKEEL